MANNIDPQKNEDEFNKFLISQYLKYGSVDAVLKKHYYSLPISTASYHRLLDKSSIVKSAGPHGKINEALAFMEYLAQDRLPLERLYKKLPPSFETSKVTLHRIYNNIKKGLTRRSATGLIITVENDPMKILLAKDISAPNLVYGKEKGSVSIPMTFSKTNESTRQSIKRVFQQEVFSKQTVLGRFPQELIQKEYPLVFEIEILDIILSIYHIELPNKYVRKCSSFRMLGHKFLTWREIEEFAYQGKLRSGIFEIVSNYRQELLGNETAKKQVAFVNRQLAVHIQ